MKQNTDVVSYSPKVVRSWIMYDWANSVYNLVITTAVFPIYYSNVTNAAPNGMVSFLGLSIKNTVLYSYALSSAFLIIALMSPLLSGIADNRGSKKFFMKIFCIIGATACMALYFFNSTHTVTWGILAFMIATMGYAGSIVFYNAFLPEIAPEHMHDTISARGYAMGYIGSSLLLILNLVMIQKPQFFGIADAGMATRIAFVSVGVWWLSFAFITFKGLPESAKNRQQTDYLKQGYKAMFKVWQQLKGQAALRRFLLAFFFYNMGVQTVMYVASLFGANEIKMSQSLLIATLLVIQFVAVCGALLFAWFSKMWGNINALCIATLIWIIVCCSAYFIYESTPFIILAGVVGLVMGGIQALSRATFAKWLPDNDGHASYFSFYDVCDKVGMVLGTLSFGLIEAITGSMRNSIFALATFFIIGMILLRPLSKIPNISKTK